MTFEKLSKPAPDFVYICTRYKILTNYANYAYIMNAQVVTYFAARQSLT